MVEMLIGFRADIRIDNDEPLYLAVKNGNIELVKTLLYYGADAVYAGTSKLSLRK